MSKPRAFRTRAVHAGEHLPAEDFVPVVGPIHATVGFVYEHMEDLDGVLGTTREGYVYPRYGSPTVSALEAAIADLEGGEAAFAFASGMAAIHVALLAAGVRQGARVAAAMDVYGATYTMLRRLFTELGAQVTLVDVTDLDAVQSVLKETHPLILVAETISNPLSKSPTSRRSSKWPTGTARRFSSTTRSHRRISATRALMGRISSCTASPSSLPVTGMCWRV